MIVADTNVLVRFVVDDDVAQADRVEAVMRSGPVRQLLTVLLELEWVLRSSYRLPRPKLLAILRGLTALPMVEVEDADRVARALDGFEAGLDFADALYLAAAGDGEIFVTFDQRLIHDAGRLGFAVPVQEP